MGELRDLLDEIEGMDEDLIANIMDIISINPEERAEKVCNYINNTSELKAAQLLDYISNEIINEEEDSFYEKSITELYGPMIKDSDWEEVIIDEDITEVYSDEDDEEVNYEDMEIVDDGDDKIFSGEFRENCLEWLNGQDVITCTISQKKFKNKILKLAKEYPEEVMIQAMNDGSTILAKIPLKYLSIRRPRELSEEERKKAAERLKAARKKKD